MNNEIEMLKYQHDEQEQYSRMNSLRISGLVEKRDENLTERIVDMACDHLNVQIDEDDIDRIHRIGPVKPNVTRNIIVKFTSFQVRNKIFRARSNLKKTREQVRQERLADEIDPEIQPSEDEEESREPEDYKGVFINEDLTRTRAHLLWLARKKKYEKSITDCWSFNGRVLIKDLQNKVKLIKTPNDLIF
jgi:exosome complex exonuclease DIS3/RRP44